MLFNSFIFWVFFFVVILLYKKLPHAGQNRMLLVASYIFYGYWDYRFLLLIFLSTVVDYFVAQSLVKKTNLTQKKAVLAISLCANLGLLGFFKYYNFFITEFGGLLNAFGLEGSFPLLNIILPVGISFYTFQTMSYTIDVYRGETKPTNHFLDFALYVSFFPQLVAGPIERSYHLLPQILYPRKYEEGDFSEGLYHVLFGMFKKVVIADNMAPIVNTVFSTPVDKLTGPEILLGIYAFAFQIYGDFSGYSSIAKGIAKWMGFDLMWNFKNPYFAITPSDFWTRWHISLSSWMRDYLYIPLGGNRSKTMRNLATTMLLGGLWHGASWTFVIWGGFHGALLVVYMIFEKLLGVTRHSRPQSRFTHLILIVILFHFVCISWLLFRAESMEQVGSMLLKLATDFEVTKLSVYMFSMIVAFVGPLFVYEYWTEKSRNLMVLLHVNWLVRVAVYSYMLLMLWVFPPMTTQDFIYFQF